MVSRACLGVQESPRTFWESEEEEEEKEGFGWRWRRSTALPRRGAESFHTRQCLREEAGHELPRILFKAEAKPSGDSLEASLFLLLEFCAGAINLPNESRSLGKLH